MSKNKKNEPSALPAPQNGPPTPPRSIAAKVHQRMPNSQFIRIHVPSGDVGHVAVGLMRVPPRLSHAFRPGATVHVSPDPIEGFYQPINNYA